MIKKSLFAVAMLSLLLITGCARKILINEVLQTPEKGKVYTKCNLWYTDSAQMFCVNYQTGKILPFGSEVEVTDVNAKAVKFKDRGGREYCIAIDEELIMVPAEVYLTQIFTLKDRAKQSANLSEAVIDKISKGIVSPGMTKAEVLLAYGAPPAFRTPSEDNSTWIYFIDKDTTKRVVFRGDKVKTMIKFKK
jgi:hypothetical protein